MPVEDCIFSTPTHFFEHYPYHYLCKWLRLAADRTSAPTPWLDDSFYLHRGSGRSRRLSGGKSVNLRGCSSARTVRKHSVSRLHVNTHTGWGNPNVTLALRSWRHFLVQNRKKTNRSLMFFRNSQWSCDFSYSHMINDHYISGTMKWPGQTKGQSWAAAAPVECACFKVFLWLFFFDWNYK